MKYEVYLNPLILILITTLHKLEDIFNNSTYDIPESKYKYSNKTTKYNKKN